MSLQLVTSWMIRRKLLDIVRDMDNPMTVSQVMTEIRQALPIETLQDEQRVLTAWHKLFTDGILSPGYDLKYPDFPFFHVNTQVRIK